MAKSKTRASRKAQTLCYCCIHQKNVTGKEIATRSIGGSKFFGSTLTVVGGKWKLLLLPPQPLAFRISIGKKVNKTRRNFSRYM